MLSKNNAMVSSSRAMAGTLAILLGACAAEPGSVPTPLNQQAAVPITQEALAAAPLSRLNFGQPGELNVQAGPGQLSAFPVPTTPRQFANRPEFLEFLRVNLNARITNDAQGNPEGAQLVTRQAGRSYYWDHQSNTAVEVRDVAAAYLGGEHGVVTIGAERVAVREDGATRVLNVQAFVNGRFRIEGLTSITHAGFYHNVGTDTRDQTTGVRDPNRALSVDSVWLGTGFLQNCSQTVIGQDFATCTISEWFTCNTACKVTCNRGNHGLLDPSVSPFSPVASGSTSEPFGC